MVLDVSITQDNISKWPLHRHECWEIMYYVRGAGILHTEYDSIPFKEHTIAIIPPGVLHGSESDNSFKNISIQADIDSMFTFNYPVSCIDNINADGGKIADMILRNNNKKGLFIDSLLIAYIDFIMQKLSIGEGVESKVENIRNQIIYTFFDSDLNVTTLLHSSGYSEDYIRSCFTKIVGISPISYLENLRMEHAIKLIKIYKGDISCGKLTEMCGYTDAVYFSKHFKRKYSVSPRAYLKQYKKDK